MFGHYRILSFGKDFVSTATETTKRSLLVRWKRGKGPAWRVKGLTADVRPIHRPYGRSPFPFRKGVWRTDFPDGTYLGRAHWATRLRRSWCAPTVTVFYNDIRQQSNPSITVFVGGCQRRTRPRNVFCDRNTRSVRPQRRRAGRRPARLQKLAASKVPV